MVSASHPIRKASALMADVLTVSALDSEMFKIR